MDPKVIKRWYSEGRMVEVFFHLGFALGYYREGEFERSIFFGPLALYWSYR